MTSAGRFRLVVGLILTVGGLAVLFTGLPAAWDGPPMFMTAELTTIAGGLVVIASAFWALGRPPDLPTGSPAAAVPDPRTGRVGGRAIGRVVGRLVVAGLAVGTVLTLFWLRP